MNTHLSTVGLALALAAGTLSSSPANAQDGLPPRPASPPISALQGGLPQSGREKEMSKIHELAKECIQANNSSPNCNEIVKLDIEMGKFFILKETPRAKREAQ